MSIFNPDTFMHQEVEGANDTAFTPVPEGEYEGYITDVGAREVTTKRGPTPLLDITYAINDDEVAEALGVENPTVRQSLFLDIDESGGLAIGAGKNVRLGQLRNAVGQNDTGKPWSPGQLEGAGPVAILVGHRHGEAGEVYAGVTKVRAL